MVPKVTLNFLYGTPVAIVPNFTPELKRIYGSVYLKERGLWAFPAFYPFHEHLRYDFNAVFGAKPGEEPQVEFSPDLLAHFAEQDELGRRMAAGEYDPAFQFVTKPYQHQLESFLYGIYNMRCGLLLDPGLGKTKVAIDVVRYVKNHMGGAKAVVIAPLVMLYKWAAEVQFHSGGQLTSQVIDGTPKQKRKALTKPADVYICTFGSAGTLAEDIVAGIDYNTVIVDESHNLQTYNSGKTEAVTYIGRKAPRRLILSGTASLGDPRHLYGQLDFLGPFLHEEGFWKFCQRYVDYIDGGKHKVVRGYKNLDILHDRLAKVSVRRKKEECLDLPPRTFVTADYKLIPEQKALYNELVMASRSELVEKIRVVEEATATARLTKLTQITSGFLVNSNKDPFICKDCPYLMHCVKEEIRPYTKDCSVVPIPPEPTTTYFKKNPKMEALGDLLDEQLLGPANKTIIWAKFLEELNMLERYLEDRSIGYVRIDGSVSGAKVKQRVDKFQTDPDTRVFIGQVASGIGIDLTAANYMIYFSLSWDLGHWVQSSDRAYRIGQTRPVTVYSLMCAGSVDEAIYEALQNKEDVRVALTDVAPEAQSKFVRKITRPAVL